MIFAVCPNPAIDITILTDSFKLFELNRALGQAVSLSGKGINVARAAGILGGKSTVAGIMFCDDLALYEAELKSQDIDHKFIPEKGAVRRNYKIIDAEGRLTEINLPSPAVSASSAAGLLSLIREQSGRSKVTVISGSLPVGLDDQFYGRMSEAVSPMAKKIIDADGERLKHALKAGAELVKPNLYELELFAGERLVSRTEILQAAGGLLDAGAKAALVSLGREGAIYTDGINACYADGLDVPIRSTVGAGDSMVAACAVAMEQGRDCTEMLTDAVAAGAAQVMSGITGIFDAEMFERLRKKVTVHKS